MLGKKVSLPTPLSPDNTNIFPHWYSSKNFLRIEAAQKKINCKTSKLLMLNNPLNFVIM